MKDNEDWKKDFVGKHAKLKPVWEGNSGKSRMNICWHVKGDCTHFCHDEEFWDLVHESLLDAVAEKWDT